MLITELVDEQMKLSNILAWSHFLDTIARACAFWANGVEVVVNKSLGGGKECVIAVYLQFYYFKCT